MNSGVIRWDVYELSSENYSLNGVMLRGRIRKLCLEKNKNVLVGNAEDNENKVRFAVINGEDISVISNYLIKIISDIRIKKIKTNLPNPVLSKIKVNLEDRYSL